MHTNCTVYKLHPTEISMNVQNTLRPAACTVQAQGPSLCITECAREAHLHIQLQMCDYTWYTPGEPDGFGFLRSGELRSSQR